jgi:hypothetical protein
MRAIGWLLPCLLVSCGGGVGVRPDAGASVTVVDPASAREITVVGDEGSASGIFDASIVYPSGASSGLMTYSSVPAQGDVHTRIAASSDGGATWTYIAHVNDAQDVTATFTAADPGCPGAAATQNGRVIHEVSSLVDDPTDAPHRYKVFTHSYLTLAGTPPTLCRDVGVVSLYRAADPAGPWSETPLIGWSSPSPLSSTGVTLRVADVAGLTDCVALTEPGARLRDGGIDLVITCIYPQAGAAAFRQELLRSTDHAATFTRIGTILGSADAQASAGAALNAGDLFVSGATEYVVLSPGGSVHLPGGPSFDGYAGCDVFAIPDPGRAAAGREIVRTLAAPGGLFSGACTYAEGATAMGYVIGIVGAAPRTFRLYDSGVRAP